MKIKSIKGRSIGFSVLIFVSIQCLAQGFMHTDNKKIMDGTGSEIILRSMGLGGWMLQEGYMMETSAFAGPQHEIRAKIEELIGPLNTDTFYAAWLNNHVRRNDIDSLAAWGFNAVRLAMHYNLFSPQELPVGSYINTGFEMVDSLLGWCEANQIYLILDLHGAPGGQGDDAAISDYDATKPSLWESEENKARTADLWKTIAARYADKEWIGAYDLINEPKWDALLNNNNHDLWELMIRITDSIRTVDPNHMIIIEGNMWANNYTGFPGPWDDNMVISFHKYWNANTTASIQWVLNMRNQYNVPVWLGETGENSNTWFVELIELMEQHSIGYSFWPEKKFSSVAGPVTVIKTSDYQQLLDYWTAPSQHPVPDTLFAKEALLQMAENLKLENCLVNRDVIDAFTRQVNNSLTIPYKNHSIPGIINATDFDMGKHTFAYLDSDYQNLGNTQYNTGGRYRNDGVDIEACTDVLNSNGYNVGWTAAGEWLNYSVSIDSTAGYSFVIRYAGMNSSTKVHLSLDSIDVTGEIIIPSTGAWNVWDSLTIHDVILTSGYHTLKFWFDQGGCNLNYIALIHPKALADVDFIALSAETDVEGYHVYLTLNKPCKTPLEVISSDFTLLNNEEAVEIQSIVVSPMSYKILILEPESGFAYNSQIKLTYNGTSVQTADNQSLEQFTALRVQNQMPARHVIPGKIEAEDFISQSGLEMETTTDSGGGLNIGYTDAGDHLDYLVDIQTAQSFQINFRVAALSQAGAIQLILYDEEQNPGVLGTFSLPVTGGWQTWQTKSAIIELPAGFYRLRVNIVTAGFNLNWFSFTQPSAVSDNFYNENILIFPNPCRDEMIIRFYGFADQPSSYNIADLTGRTIIRKALPEFNSNTISIDTSKLIPGFYIFSLATASEITGVKFRVEEWK